MDTHTSVAFDILNPSILQNIFCHCLWVTLKYRKQQWYLVSNKRDRSYPQVLNFTACSSYEIRCFILSEALLKHHARQSAIMHLQDHHTPLPSKILRQKILWQLLYFKRYDNQISICKLTEQNIPDMQFLL